MTYARYERASNGMPAARYAAAPSALLSTDTSDFQSAYTAQVKAKSARPGQWRRMGAAV